MEAHVALLATDGSLGSVTDFGSEADSPSRWVSSSVGWLRVSGNPSPSLQL